MAITSNDIIFLDKKIVGIDQNVDLIAKYTENTWQQNRGFEEKKRDTAQGKNAELAVIHYLEHFSSIRYIPYDNFRDDGFEKHAPFDGIAFSNSLDINIVKTIIKKINNEISKSDYGEISPDLRSEIFENGIRCVEIKSTMINSRKLKSDGTVSLDEILLDDFLTYPVYARSGYFSTNEYLFYAKRKAGIPGYLSLEQIKPLVLTNEIKYNSDLFVRVYVGELGYYLIGYISKEKLLENGEIKKMVKLGKSKNALYFAKNLKMGMPMASIEKQFL